MKEALKLALEALEKSIDNFPANVQHTNVIAVIKAALAQPAQEPVSVTYKEVADAMNSLWNGTLEQHQIAQQMANKKLYTTPPSAQQEPVAWLTKNKFSGEVDLDAKNAKETTGWSAAFPVYTTPQQRPWVELTHQETKDCMKAWDGNDAYVLCRAIEAKLKELNT
jgi:hypothetical protein